MFVAEIEPTDHAVLPPRTVFFSSKTVFSARLRGCCRRRQAGATATNHDNVRDSLSMNAGAQSQRAAPVTFVELLQRTSAVCMRSLDGSLGRDLSVVIASFVPAEQRRISG